MFYFTQTEETPYPEAFALQKKLRALKLEKKIPNLLWLTSHPPVFTLGKQDCHADFLSSPEEIQKEGIEIIQSNRGGRITYHGPGQVVGYFIVNIRELKLSIPDFVRQIEELLIRTLEKFQISGERDAEYPGVWVKEKKIAALGLHFDRGVSMHGFALNVNPNLNHYRHIIPCGIQGREVSSLEKELGQFSHSNLVQKYLKEALQILWAEPWKEVSFSSIL